MTKLLASPLAAAVLALVMLGAQGCVDKPTSGATSGTALYIYDNASHSVKAWNDVNALWTAVNPVAPATATAVPAPDREITGDSISSMAPLAWGGIAVNSYSNTMYLVSAKGGKVTRIQRANSQNGWLSQISDITTFTLGANGELYSGGSFGQASVNTGTGALYVTETNSDLTLARIWLIPNASTIADQGVVTPVASYSVLNPNTSDSGVAGVAAGQRTAVYGFFSGGSAVTPGGTSGGSNQTGPRIRSGPGYFANFVVVGANTSLLDPSSTTTYGSLGYDSLDGELYVSRQSSSTTLPAVLVFSNAQISGLIVNPAPSRALGEKASDLPLLRIIAHPGTKDWLAGANTDSTLLKGTNTLLLWKNPSQGGLSSALLLDPGVQIGGMALASSN